MSVYMYLPKTGVDVCIYVPKTGVDVCVDGRRFHMDPVDIVVKTLQQVPQELLQWGADIYCIDFGFRYPEMRYKNV